MAKGSKCQNWRFWAKAIFSICRHVSIIRAYYSFSLWLHLLATDVAKRSKRQNFANLLWQKEVTAITTAEGSNYLIVLAGYVTSPMAERSRTVSQSQMTLYLGQPISTNVFWWCDCFRTMCVCVCPSVCLCLRSGPVNQTTLKRLMLRISDFTCTFPGTVWTWSLKSCSFFQKGAWPMVVRPPNFLGGEG